MENELDVRFIREMLDLTQAELAERVGVDQSTVSNWENGRPPRGPTKKLLAMLAAEASKAAEQAGTKHAEAAE